MTLPRPHGQVVPRRVEDVRAQLEEHRRSFEAIQADLDEIAMQFPIQARNIAPPALVNSLPSSPHNGQQAFFSPSVGVVWHVVFDRAAHDDDGYGWVVIGGSPLHHEVIADQSTNSTTYTNLGSVGPQIQLPRAGIWDIFGAANIYHTGSTAAWNAVATPKIGSANPSDNDRLAQAGGIQSTGGRSATPISGRKIRRTCGAVTLLMQYRVTSSVTVNFAYRIMSAMPVRLES